MKRIVVIRPGALGDALLAFPVIQALRQQFVGEKVQVMLVSHAAVLDLSRAWGVAQVTYNYDTAYWSELFLDRGIRTPRLREELARTDLAVGWLRDSEGLVERNLYEVGCQRVIVAPGRPGDEVHEHIVRYLGRTVGLEMDEREPFKLLSGLTPLQQANREEDVGKRQQRRIAIHPGSGGARKCWPVEQFARIIGDLQQQGRPILLLSGPADEERIAQLRDLLQQTKRGLAEVQILANAPLLEVCRELQSCRFYLGNDAGMTHLAALFGLPTIVLFGPSDPQTWRPIGNQIRVIYEPRLEFLKYEAVVELFS